MWTLPPKPSEDPPTRQKPIHTLFLQAPTQASDITIALSSCFAGDERARHSFSPGKMHTPHSQQSKTSHTWIKILLVQQE